MTWQSGVFYPRKCQQFLRIRIKEKRTKGMSRTIRVCLHRSTFTAVNVNYVCMNQYIKEYEKYNIKFKILTGWTLWKHREHRFWNLSGTWQCREIWMPGALPLALQSRRKDSHLPMDGSKEKTAKSLTGINGHMWTVIWIRTPKGLSLRGSVHDPSVNFFLLVFTQHAARAHQWLGEDRTIERLLDPSQSKAWKEQRLKMESACLRYLTRPWL